MKLEMMVSNWIFENGAGDREEVIFKSGDFVIMRQDMETLKGGQDTFTIVMPNKASDSSDILKRFSESFDVEFSDCCASKIEEIQLVSVIWKVCHALDISSVGGNKTLKFDGIPEKLNSSAFHLCMPWRDKDNKIDYAIFAMRHIKTCGRWNQKLG